MFLTPEEISAAEREVIAAREVPKKKSKPPKGKPTIDDLDSVLDDVTEHGLPLPKSSYDGCEKSFTAADERNQKASTSAFEVTGLMALVCRHDHVISIANITSAGEKQHYPIALLKRLKRGLPSAWKVGVLYDVGCQMHKSITKVCPFVLLLCAVSDIS